MKRAFFLSAILAVYLATHANNPTIVQVRQWMIRLVVRGGGSDSAFAQREKVMEAISSAQRAMEKQKKQ
jgi:hypothetical protein